MMPGWEEEQGRRTRPGRNKDDGTISGKGWTVGWLVDSLDGRRKRWVVGTSLFSHQTPEPTSLPLPHLWPNSTLSNFNLNL